jgi:hypothetical protein
MAAGTTSDSYDEVRSINPSGYDPIDQIIISSALDLEERHIKVFGLLYNCHNIEEVAGRLQQKGYKPLRTISIQRYKSDSKRRIIELVTNDQSRMERIRQVLKAEYAKRKS